MIYPSNLRIEVATYRSAGGDVGLHDITYNLDGLAVLEDGRIVVCLLDDLVPLCSNVSMDPAA